MLLLVDDLGVSLKEDTVADGEPNLDFNEDKDVVVLLIGETFNCFASRSKSWSPISEPLVACFSFEGVYTFCLVVGLRILSFCKPPAE